MYVHIQLKFGFLSAFISVTRIKRIILEIIKQSKKIRLKKIKNENKWFKIRYDDKVKCN